MITGKLVILGNGKLEWNNNIKKLDDFLQYIREEDARQTHLQAWMIP